MATETIIARIDPKDPDTDIIKRAGDIIRAGGLVAFPTETVYGLGGDALNAGSSALIYAAKGRPSDNPLIVHISDIKDLTYIAKDIPDEAYLLADKFWPGPLTLILHKTERVPSRTTGGLDTVAVRFPSDPIAQLFIAHSGGFIAAPSANISGRPSPTTSAHVIEDMDGRIDMILAGDDSLIGLESTIVDLTSGHPVILRPGYITYEMLKEVIPSVTMDEALLSEDEHVRPKAPGMKYRHYAPAGELTIVKGSAPDVIKYINERTREDSLSGLKTGVIASDETASSYSAGAVLSFGTSRDVSSAAHRLFGLLRQMDDLKVDRIYSESFEETGLGSAIMNRLTKAAGHKIIEV